MPLPFIFFFRLGGLLQGGVGLLELCLTRFNAKYFDSFILFLALYLLRVEGLICRFQIIVDK